MLLAENRGEQNYKLIKKSAKQSLNCDDNENIVDSRNYDISTNRHYDVSTNRHYLV